MTEPAQAVATRVVFVNRYFYPDLSATSQMLTDLACGLAGKGFDVHVVCSRQLYGDAAANLPAYQLVSGVHVSRVATTCFGRARLAGRALDYLSFYVSCAFTLMQLVRRRDVLVAKTDPPLLSMLAAPVAYLKSALLVNWLQDVFPEVATQLGVNPLPKLLDAMLKRIRDASLRFACMNVVIGDRMREMLIDRGVSDSRLCVIENWSDHDMIQPKLASESRLRASLCLENNFVVCYSGNLGRAHEFATFLGAAETLRDDSKIVFLIIGSGAKLAELQQEVARRFLRNFRFLPYQPRDMLADSLAAADVHLVSLLPELEGLIVPSKLYGILAAGRPSVFIGDSDGEIARVIRRVCCGRVVSVGDSDQLAEVLRSMDANPKELAESGARARRLLCEAYTLSRALERWVTLLRSCECPVVKPSKA